MHLTNYSVNKKNTSYAGNEDATATTGHKWSLEALFQYLRDKEGINTDLLWQQMCDVIIKVSESMSGF
jgi:hypothetical protein